MSRRKDGRKDGRKAENYVPPLFFEKAGDDNTSNENSVFDKQCLHYLVFTESNK